MSKPVNRHLWVKMAPPYNPLHRWRCKKCGSKLTSSKRPDPDKLLKRTIDGQIHELTCQEAMVLHLHNC